VISYILGRTRAFFIRLWVDVIICLCSVLYHYFVNLLNKRMATGVDILTPEQDTESFDHGAQYFCHECDKKFTTDRSESDDVRKLWLY